MMKIQHCEIGKDTPSLSNEESAVCIGNFDGVHLGHQFLLKNFIELAKNRGLESCVITFSPHPYLYFHPEENEFLISSEEEKLRLLDSFGVDKVFIINFDPVFQALSGREFLKNFLVEKLKVKLLYLGHDSTFGSDHLESKKYLSQLCRENLIDLFRERAFEWKATLFSSQSIRDALLEGTLDRVRGFLGREYSLRGIVHGGNKIGRTLEYPTINLKVHEKAILPKQGVYSGYLFIDETKYAVAINIGRNPTVVDKGEKRIEGFILDFSGNLYSQEMTLFFSQYLRSEQKFSTFDELKKQISKDVQRVRGDISL